MSAETADPRQYQAIMLSSTFIDLIEHRRRMIGVIEKLNYRAAVMENVGALATGDVIDSSLDLVRDAVLYVLILGRRYGQIPVCASRNPDGLSITELEYEEARRLGRPILVFVMGDQHPPAEIDNDSDQQQLLEAFRQRVIGVHEERQPAPVYELFDSIEQFTNAATVAIALHLLKQRSSSVGAGDKTGSFPDPPRFAALPPYLGSHRFVGRSAELDLLTRWSAPEDQNSMLLFDAIGGSGKSMLTWEWATRHATVARSDWAGRLWYSFYERGAVMAEFLCCGLAYMRNGKQSDFQNLSEAELADRFIDELADKPWLFILDGLERVLTAYHRIDAAQVSDSAVEESGLRDPTSATRPEDDELLRRLTNVLPSKILVTSRLLPSALLNAAKRPRQGVSRLSLGGLTPADAEALLRSCEVEGQSKTLRHYLQMICGCHPLVIGVLAGLINTYAPAPGDFDAWLDDPKGGRWLNLGEVDLVQRHNHILTTALEALPSDSRELLQTLALLQAGVSYPTLSSFNPHLPLPPHVVGMPVNPSTRQDWEHVEPQQRMELMAEYEKKQQHYVKYLDEQHRWQRQPNVIEGSARFNQIVGDLERRGLIQYDRGEKLYDLHPVVRRVTVGRIGGRETGRLGQRATDYFTSAQHDPWHQAETLAELSPGLQVVRLRLRMGEYLEAFKLLNDGILEAMYFNIGAFEELELLLGAFFLNGWNGDPIWINDYAGVSLLNNAAVTLAAVGNIDQATILARRAITYAAGDRNLESALITSLGSYALMQWNQGALASAVRLQQLALETAIARNQAQGRFTASLALFSMKSACGHSDAGSMIPDLEAQAGTWPRNAYRQGDLQRAIAQHRLAWGELGEEELAAAETVAREARNRDAIVALAVLRGEWHLGRDEPSQAMSALRVAIEMRRRKGLEDLRIEALFNLAYVRTGARIEISPLIERMANASGNHSLAAAELFNAMSEHDRARDSAAQAYLWALADGEPFTRRATLNRTSTLLASMGVRPPLVPRYDGSGYVEPPWETTVRNALAFIAGPRSPHDFDTAGSRAPRSELPEPGLDFDR